MNWLWERDPRMTSRGCPTGITAGRGYPTAKERWPWPRQSTPQDLPTGGRLFAASKYTRFARAVASLNRGLVTGSYRSGAGWSVATAIQEPFERAPDSRSKPKAPGPISRSCWLRTCPTPRSEPARRASQVAPPRRRARLRAGDRAQRRGRPHRRQAELHHPRLRHPPPLRATIRPGPVRAEPVHRRGAPPDLMEQSPDNRANMLG
jgi:hypothetical protein